MSAGRRSGLAVLLTAAAVGAAACGGDTADPPSKPADTSPSNGVNAQGQAPDLALPDNVPRKARGPAKRSATRVIRRWLRALDRGDIERAAHYFALPSKFQNTGTPVLNIDNEAERIAVNLSLTCGAKAEKTGGAGPYTIVLFRLIDRPGPGGGCGSGIGGTARGALLVSGGLIREWYRLPDDPDAEPDPAATGPSA